MSPSGRPKISAPPDVGKTSCISSFSVVVLPAPFGPRKPKTSPASTSSVRRSSARYGRLRQNPIAKSLVSSWVARARTSFRCGALQLDRDRLIEILRRQAAFDLDAVDEEGRRRLDAQLTAERDVALDLAERRLILGVEIVDLRDVARSLADRGRRHRRLVRI